MIMEEYSMNYRIKGMILGLALLLVSIPAEAAQSTDEFVKQLQRSYVNGYTYDDHMLIQLNTSKPLEVVSIFKREEDYWNDYMIYVHELHQGEWKQSYQRSIEDRSNLMFVTKGRMGATDKVVLGSFEGSGGFMDAFLIGSPNGRDIRLMQQKTGLFQGGAIILDGTLFYSSAGIAHQKYRVTNGKVVSNGRTAGRDDRFISGNPNIWIGLTKSGSRSVYTGKKTIYAKVGDRIGIGRQGLSDSRGYGYRLMSYGSFMLDDNPNRYGFIAKRKGTTVFSLEPEAYGDAVEIKIIVR